MHESRRIRIELSRESYEALKYFCLLRGVPIGRGLSRTLAIYAASVEKEFPAVAAHMLAWREALKAEPNADPVVDTVPF